MSTIPSVRGGASALTPLVRRVEFNTDVAMFQNGREQRFATRRPLNRLSLPYPEVSSTDVTSLESFINSAKGAYDVAGSLTVGSDTWADLALEGDGITVTEADAKLYSTSLKLRQVKRASYTPPSPGSSYPTFSAGVVAQRPYVRIRRFFTQANDMESGLRYSWAWFGGGLSTFPTGALMSWELTYPVMTDADVATLENFFAGQWGRLLHFSFTDPDSGTTYANCRFGMDGLEITKNAPNLNAVAAVRIDEYYP